MGYNKSPFKMAPKSPLTKALKGNQGKLPRALQDAIKAAPESPAKQTKEEASAYVDGLREKRALKAEKSGDKGRAQRIRSTKNTQDGVKSPAKQTLEKSAKKAFESGKMDKYGKPTLKKTASETFKSGKMDKYAKSPAKAMTGPGVQKEAGKTGTAGTNSARGKDAYEGRAPRTNAQTPMGPSKPAAKKPAAPAPAAKAPAAKPKWDKELNSLVAERKGLKKGTAEYNRVQNRINEKMGSGVRRPTEETTKLAPKKPTTASTAAPKPAAPKPAAQKPAAKKAPSQADKFENALAKENAKAPMGSETRSKAPAAQKPAAQKPVAKKPAAKKTVGQKVKGTVRNARLAQLDRKANRQAAKAADKKSKGAGKLSGLGK
jgi:hypothetical protein